MHPSPEELSIPAPCPDPGREERKGSKLVCRQYETASRLGPGDCLSHPEPSCVIRGRRLGDDQTNRHNSTPAHEAPRRPVISPASPWWFESSSIARSSVRAGLDSPHVVCWS